MLLCRPRPDAERTARRLAEVGHDSLVAPVLERVTVPADFAAIARVDALVMSSPQVPLSMGPTGLTRWRTHPVYAVGATTAAAARHQGFRDVRIGAGDGARLVDLLRLTRPAPADLLYLAGRIRKPDLEAGLMAAGYVVQTVEVYDAREAPAWDPAVRKALAAGSLEACLHFSRRSADLALRFARAAGVADAFGRLRHVCLSAETAIPLLEAGLTSVTVAGQPSESAVVALLDRAADAPALDARIDPASGAWVPDN